MQGNQLVATINPSLTVVEGWTFEDTQVFNVIDKIAKEMLVDARAEKKEAEKASKSPMKKITVTNKDGQQVEVDQKQIDLTKRSSPAAGVVALGKGRQHVTVGQTETGKPIVFEHGVEQAPSKAKTKEAKEKEKEWQGIGPGGGAQGRYYGGISDNLKDKPVGDWMKALATGKPLPKEAEAHAGDLGELYGLMMAKEPKHGGGAHRRDRD